MLNACHDWFKKLNSLRNLVAHPLRGDLTNGERDYLLDSDQKVRSLTARIEEVMNEGPGGR